MITGYRVFRDGAAWCAIGPNFRDLQMSPAGFGETQAEAIGILLDDESFQNWHRRMNIAPPCPADFVEVDGP